MRGKPFERGNPDGRAGRPKGTPNKTSKEARALAQALVSDPAYVAALQQRLIDGKAGDMERLLWHYSFGSPSAHPVSALDDLDLFGG